jgi:hypothetical protein
MTLNQLLMGHKPSFRICSRMLPVFAAIFERNTQIHVLSEMQKFLTLQHVAGCM